MAIPPLAVDKWQLKFTLIYDKLNHAFNNWAKDQSYKKKNVKKKGENVYFNMFGEFNLQSS